MDIFLTEGDFHIFKMPCKIIYDTEILEENQVYIDRFETRRCGLQFGILTEELAAQLEFFLKNYTTGTA